MEINMVSVRQTYERANQTRINEDSDAGLVLSGCLECILSKNHNEVGTDQPCLDSNCLNYHTCETYLKHHKQ